jgi:hypothetical protein
MVTIRFKTNGEINKFFKDIEDGSIEKYYSSDYSGGCITLMDNRFVRQKILKVLKCYYGDDSITVKVIDEDGIMKELYMKIDGVRGETIKRLVIMNLAARYGMRI